MNIYLIALILQIWILLTCYNQNSFQRYNKIAVLPCFIILSFVFAFRTETGIDDNTYMSIFNEIALYHTNSESLQRIDYSYRLISRIFAGLGFSYQMVFIFYSFLSFLLIYKSVVILCDDKEQVILSVLSFNAFCLTVCITVMRQFLSAALILYSVALISKNQKRKSVIMLMFAVFFHKGALLCIPIQYFFFYKGRYCKEHFKCFLPIISIVLLGCTFFLKYIIIFLKHFFPIYVIYTEFQNWGVLQEVALTKILMLIIFYIQLLFFKANHIKISNKNNLLEIGEVVYLSIYFSTLTMGWIHRAEVYYILFSLFLFSTLYKKFNLIQNRKKVFFVCLTFIVFYSFYSIYMEQFVSNSIIPYKYNFDIFL